MGQPKDQHEEVIKAVIIEVHGGKTISAYGLELFGRVFDGRIRPGWAMIGNEFMFSEDPPWKVRWDELNGTTDEKLAAFDPKLAADVKGRKITLQAAKKVLLRRDCDTLAQLRISQLMQATAPYLTLVPRFIGTRTASHYLALKCTCGACWERLSFFGCENWYWAHCPACHLEHCFKMHDDCFEFKPAPTNDAAKFAGGLNQCIPIRELEVAACSK